MAVHGVGEAPFFSGAVSGLGDFPSLSGHGTGTLNPRSAVLNMSFLINYGIGIPDLFDI